MDVQSIANEYGHYRSDNGIIAESYSRESYELLQWLCNQYYLTPKGKVDEMIEESELGICSDRLHEREMCACLKSILTELFDSLRKHE